MSRRKEVISCLSAWQAVPVHHCVAATDVAPEKPVTARSHHHSYIPLSGYIRLWEWCRPSYKIAFDREHTKRFFRFRAQAQVILHFGGRGWVSTSQTSNRQLHRAHSPPLWHLTLTVCKRSQWRWTVHSADNKSIISLYPSEKETAGERNWRVLWDAIIAAVQSRNWPQFITQHTKWSCLFPSFTGNVCTTVSSTWIACERKIVWICVFAFSFAEVYMYR